MLPGAATRMPRVSRSVGPKPGKLLHGSDLIAAGKRAIAGVILSARQSPANFNAPYIIDFDTDILPEISSWPCNMTQTRKLAMMINDETEKWVGWGLVLHLTTANNPKTNRDVASLEVASVIPPDVVKKKRKTKPSYANSGKDSEGRGEPINFDDVPF